MECLSTKEIYQPYWDIREQNNKMKEQINNRKLVKYATVRQKFHWLALFLEIQLMYSVNIMK